VRLYPIVLLLVALPSLVHGQDPVTIHGRVITTTDQHTYYDLMIVNKRTRSGTFGNSDGSFTVQALRTDTLMIGSIGHRTGILCLKDSVERGVYDIKIRLIPLQVQLAEVEILPERTLKEIQADIDKLGYKPSDYKLTTVNALQSPITALYQEFSRRERSKRLVAELVNEDKKRAILQELLHKYVEYDIINLNPDAFDDFIEFCSVPDEVIKGLTQYEFLVYIKRKYELYSSLGPTRRH
jgi:hypothetical protein